MNPEHTEPILNLVSPPPSGEEPIPFETLVEAARLALPADMPRILRRFSLQWIWMGRCSSPRDLRLAFAK